MVGYGTVRNDMAWHTADIEMAYKDEYSIPNVNSQRINCKIQTEVLGTATVSKEVMEMVSQGQKHISAVY